MIREIAARIRHLVRPRVESVANVNPSLMFTSDQKRYAAFQIGEWTYGAPSVLSFGEPSTLVIGKFCSIANGVTILLGGEHRTDWVTTYPFSAAFLDAEGFKGHPRTKGDVIIGSDVWIGQDSFILSGVTVGNGAVIGARSVVSKDVASYSIVTGNPAKIVRYRFPQSTIDILNEIAWWNWPLPRIKEAWAFLLSSEIDVFISRYYTRQKTEV